MTGDATPNPIHDTHVTHVRQRLEFTVAAVKELEGVVHARDPQLHYTCRSSSSAWLPAREQHCASQKELNQSGHTATRARRPDALQTPIQTHITTLKSRNGPKHSPVHLAMLHHPLQSTSTSNIPLRLAMPACQQYMDMCERISHISTGPMRLTPSNPRTHATSAVQPRARAVTHATGP